MVVLVIFHHNFGFCYFFFNLTVFRVTGSEYKYKNGIFNFEWVHKSKMCTLKFYYVT